MKISKRDVEAITAQRPRRTDDLLCFVAGLALGANNHDACNECLHGLLYYVAFEHEPKEWN